MSDIALPPSLLTRLRSDENALYSDLSSSSLSTSLAAARSLATRKLLASTPEAIDRTLTIMRTADPKNQLAAASLILSKSPATSDPASSSSESSLPPALLATLSAALASLSSAFSNLTQAELKPPGSLRSQPAPTLASDISTTILEEAPVKSEPLPILNLPSASPQAELTASGVVPKPKKPKKEKTK